MIIVVIVIIIVVVFIVIIIIIIIIIIIPSFRGYTCTPAESGLRERGADLAAEKGAGLGHSSY